MEQKILFISMSVDGVNILTEAYSISDLATFNMVVPTLTVC